MYTYALKYVQNKEVKQMKHTTINNNGDRKKKAGLEKKRTSHKVVFVINIKLESGRGN